MGLAVESNRAESSRPLATTPTVAIVILNWNGYE